MTKASTSVPFLTGQDLSCIIDENMKSIHKKGTGFTLSLICFFYILSLILYFIQYGKFSQIPAIYYNETIKNGSLFFINFFVPFCISGLSGFGYFKSSNPFYKIILFCIGTFSITFATYQLPDNFTTKLSLFISYSILFGWQAFPSNVITLVFSFSLFSISLFHPNFIGQGNISLTQYNPSVADSFVIYICLFFAWFSTSLSRFNMNTSILLENTIEHLHVTESQLSTVNQKLQENTKKFGEEATKQERSRITRDMHDSCGYVFTNIIALAEAAISIPEIDDDTAKRIFNFIRNQSSDGLQRTRETLHLIREIQSPVSTGIQDIYELKHIFEEVTNIEIIIETGNMNHKYGRIVNATLRRIVQEALTNSLRHGHATKILIQFWEFPELLTMTVTDNGSGSNNIVKGIGFLGMEERLALLGGTLDFSSPEDGGFKIHITIPLTGREEKYENGGTILHDRKNFQ